MKSIEEFGLTFEIYQEVYEPCHDSLLLADMLKETKGKDCLEIGPGCGLISLVLANAGNNVTCVDLNPHAVECTRANAEANGLQIKVLEGDMFEPVDGKFDLLIFNPPYLPTLDEDELDKWHDMATAGGIDGLRLTERFLKGSPEYLNEGGSIFTVVSSLSPGKAVKKMLEPFEIIDRTDQKHFFELITIYELRPIAMNSGQ